MAARDGPEAVRLVGLDVGEASGDVGVGECTRHPAADLRWRARHREGAVHRAVCTIVVKQESGNQQSGNQLYQV